MGHAPSSLGHHTKQGTTGRPVLAAACNAGLSRTRRSCLNQTTIGASPSSSSAVDDASPHRESPYAR